ncbi:MAG: DNA primase [Dehalococcoidia bacterium]|nr:DNA primase [Dehalococcoidia bacterium]MSQ16549.1 DNA primase [Dehalococcoidia bacterium]
MTELDDIKARLDILEVVSSYVPMQRSGRSYKANCPFHQEKTPSFFVFPDRQSWRCFGACATGGDLFSFVMRAENLDFPEALRRLAQRAGVALTSGGRRGEQQSLYQINEAARRVFQERLASAQGASTLAYLVQRGLTPETISKFELGLSPIDGQALRQQLMQEGFTLEQLLLAGLVRQNEQGQHRDLFRGRLIIPIRNTRGELAGFGGRAMVSDGPGSQPKYLNSPRSPVFDKGRILYALNQAKDAVREPGIVVVEGYMDAIMAHQHGFANVVASMGVAITGYQVAEARRLTNRVILVLDPDAAGQQATFRKILETLSPFLQPRNTGQAGAINILQQPDMPEVNVALMPDGLDPDEVIRRSPEEWSKLLAEAMPMLDYFFSALSARLDLTTPQGKAQLAEMMFPLISAVPQAAQQDHYFQLLAKRMGISEETLRASVGRPTASTNNRMGRGTVRTSPRQATESAFARLDRDPVEDYCLALLLQHSELRAALQPGEAQIAGAPSYASLLRQEYFLRVENREIFNHLALATPENAPALVLAALQGKIDPELTEHLEALLHKTLPPQDPQHRRSALEEVARRLEDRYLRSLKAEESLKFGEPSPESPDLLEEFQQEVLDLNQRIKMNQSRPRQVGGLEPKLSAPKLSARG